MARSRFRGAGCLSRGLECPRITFPTLLSLCLVSVSRVINGDLVALNVGFGPGLGSVTRRLDWRSLAGKHVLPCLRISVSRPPGALAMLLVVILVASYA